MTGVATDSPYRSFYGGQYPVRVCEMTLTVADGATTATATSPTVYKGTVEKIEIDPAMDGATPLLKAGATIKGYEASTALATATRDHFLDYTVPNPAVERVMYPHLAGTLNTGAAADPTISRQYVVSDQLKVDLAGADAANSVVIRIYVRG